MVDCCRRNPLVLWPGGNRRLPAFHSGLQRRSSHRRARTQLTTASLLIVGAILNSGTEDNPRPPAAGRNLLLSRAARRSDTSSKPPPIPTPSSENRRLVRLRCESPPIATMSMSSGRPPLHQSSAAVRSTKSSPTSKDGRTRRLPAGCVASILQAYLDEFVCSPSTASQNPPRCFPLAHSASPLNAEPLTYEHVDRTGAMCISRFSLDLLAPDNVLDY